MQHWLAWFHEQTQSEEVKRVAQTAETLGFSGVAMSDHIAIPKHQEARHPLTRQAYAPEVPNIDPFTVAAAMGAVTSKLNFMTYALVSGMRDPFSIARQSASLAGLTDNRFALGITPGWLTDEIALLGHNPKTRGKRFDEALKVMTGLWQNDLFSFEGEFYNFNDVAVCPRPSIAPRIYIGGNTKKSFERAKHYDGWIGMYVSIEEAANIAAIVRADDANKKIFIIAPQPMSDDYISQLTDVGVDGLIHMLWNPGETEAEPCEVKCQRMEQFAKRWIQ